MRLLRTFEYSLSELLRDSRTVHFCYMFNDPDSDDSDA
jgi:hypothetical protein